MRYADTKSLFARMCELSLRDNDSTMALENLDGLEGILTGYGEVCGTGDDAMMFVLELDGLCIAFVEDPSDGYRSYCEGVMLTSHKPTIKIPPTRVKFKHDDTSPSDEVQIRIWNVDEPFICVGTDHMDDWYPCYYSRVNLEVLNSENF